MGRPKKRYFGSDQDIGMCIYKIEEKSTGRIYIGKTERNAFLRWSEHCNSKSQAYIARALRKHGYKAFSFAVIDVAENTESLYQKEIFWIKKFNCVAPDGFNLNGGEGQPASEDFKNYMSKIVYPRVFGRPSRKSVKASETDVDKFWKKLRLSIEATIRQTGKPIFKLRKPVIRSDGVTFSGIVEAAEAMNVNDNSIRRVLNGRRNSIKGYTFKYYEERE